MAQKQQTMLFLGSFIPVLGMGLNILRVPLHKMMLSCDQGEVTVGVHPPLPLDGVAMILGNDICRSQVWAEGLPPAIVVPDPLVSSGPDIGEAELPEVFSTCVVTRAHSKATEKVDTPEQNVGCPNVPWSISHSELVKEQQAYESRRVLLAMAVPGGEVKNLAQCYFVENDVLLRKWVPQWESFVGDPLYQAVVPSKFCSLVLQVSHAESGHLGIRKTYDHILRWVFLDPSFELTN